MKSKLFRFIPALITISLISTAVYYVNADREDWVYSSNYRTNLEAKMACDEWAGNHFYGFTGNPNWSHQGYRGGAMMLVDDESRYWRSEGDKSNNRIRLSPAYKSIHYINGPASSLKLKPEHSASGMPSRTSVYYVPGKCVEQKNMYLGFRYNNATLVNFSDREYFNPVLTKRFLFP